MVEGVFSFLTVCIFLLFIIGLILLFFKTDFRIMNKETDIEISYLVLEESLLKRICCKKGIDLDKEQIISSYKKRKKFRDKLYDEMIAEMFGKNKNK